MGEVEIQGRLGRLYALADWPPRLAALNLLWILGVLAGGVAFGVAPATVALFELTRQVCLGRRSALWREFWRRWRANLLTAQVAVGLPLLTVWVLVFYLLASRDIRPVFVALTVLTAGYLMTMLYLPAVFAHVTLPVGRLWALTALVAWRRPLLTVGLAVACAGILGLTAWFVPVALLFFAVSVPALVITKVALHILAGVLPGPPAPTADS